MTSPGTAASQSLRAGRRRRWNEAGGLVLKNDRSYEWRKSREGADDPERHA